MRHARRFGTVWNFNNWYVPVAFVASAMVLTVETAQTRAVLLVEETSVVTAAEQQNWARVQTLIQEGADINADQPDGATALHWAVHWNEPATVTALIEAGVEVNAVNDLGVPPLWIAIDGGNTDVAIRLIEAGANVNARLATGETVVMTAARNGLRTVVSRLLREGADVRLAEHEAAQTALMWAAAGGHADVVRVLAESGADIHSRTSRGFTALMFAAQIGDVATAQVLLEAGADLEGRALDGSTPLLVASRSVDALAGIDWRIIPSQSGHQDTALFFIHQGADVTATDKRGRTALHAAVETRRPILAKALIDAGAGIDGQLRTPPPPLRGDYISRNSFKGASPFWLAARDANLPMMRILLEAGADPFLPNAYNVTPLMIASGLGENDARRPQDHLVVDAVRLLLDLGADITVTNRYGQTALHGAASMWEDGVIQLLVDHGADVNAEDQRGRTPLYLVEYGNANAPSESTADLLRRLGAAEPVVQR